MSLTQERIMDLGVEVAEEMRDEDGDSYAIDEAWFADYCTRFLSRIREEQEAVAWLVPDGTEWFPSKRALINNSIPLFTIPPSSPESACAELVEALEKIANESLSQCDGDANWLQLIAQETLAKHKASSPPRC